MHLEGPTVKLAAQGNSMYLSQPAGIQVPQMLTSAWSNISQPVEAALTFAPQKKRQPSRGSRYSWRPDARVYQPGLEAAQKATAVLARLLLGLPKAARLHSLHPDAQVRDSRSRGFSCSACFANAAQPLSVASMG